MFDEGCVLRIRFLGIGKGAKAEAKLKTKKEGPSLSPVWQNLPESTNKTEFPSLESN